MTNKNERNISKEQLTAYALGELNKSQVALVEHAVAVDTELARELEEISSMCSSLHESFHSFDGSNKVNEYQLKPAQKNQLKSTINSDNGIVSLKNTSSRNKRAFWGSMISIAAALLLIVFVWQQTLLDREPTYADHSGVDQIALVNSEAAPGESKKQDLLADDTPSSKAKPKKPSNQVNLKNMSPRSAAYLNFGSSNKNSNSEAPIEWSPSEDKVMGLGPQVAHSEDYSFLPENDYQFPSINPLSTFAADVDTASYANIRRFITGGMLPPKDSVRIEEMINYFDYRYDDPTDARPFAVNVETAEAPWNSDHQLIRIGLKAKKIDWQKRPNSNLVFLLDVSGSMSNLNKLPLLKKSFKMMVEQLGENDRVAIVVYAGASGVVLPSTSASNSSKILEAIENLESGGSTNGGAGIELAYKIAQQNFIKDGINRVLLATDGDFNVGVASRGALIRLIQQKAKSNVFLSIFGFGMRNYKDSVVEDISGKGNGTYAYIDNIQEAKKVLVEQIGGTMMTVAKDVKLQVEFNPIYVQAYRLIGYENRKMASQDFHNDKKDGGEIGAGHSVTALYEIVPIGIKFDHEKLPKLKYQQVQPVQGGKQSDLLTLKVRYKKPESSRSALDEYEISNKPQSFAQASVDFKFASAVAAYGMLLKDSKYAGKADLKRVKTWAEQGQGPDIHGYRSEFLKMLDQTISLKK